MSNRFLASAAAAALFAGTSFACAQGTGTNREAPAGGSTIQQNVPSTSTPASRGDAAAPPSADLHMKSTKSYEKLPREGRRAQGAPHDERSKTMHSQTNQSGKSDKNMRADDRHQRTAEEPNGMKSDFSKSAAGNTSAGTTTGQAGGPAKLSTEQRTKITAVIRKERVEPVTNINFSISVGTRVPRTVSFHPLPTEIVEIYPNWRGYEFFMVRGQIIVVDPDSLEIVAVLET